MTGHITMWYVLVLVSGVYCYAIYLWRKGSVVLTEDCNYRSPFFLCAFLLLTFGEPCADSKRGLLCEAGMEEPGADCLQWEGAGGLCKRMVRKASVGRGFRKGNGALSDKYICPETPAAFS